MQPQTIFTARLKRYVWLLAVVWTALMAASIFGEFNNTQTVTRGYALLRARENFAKDLSIRYWAASHGGVYVPVSDNTPPNPHLDFLPERDIITPSGVHLTLMNPAHIIRQLYEEYSQHLEIQGHITSLAPLNPHNAPDPWEREALLAFEQGQTEVVDTVEIDNTSYLRMMRPLVTEAPCLKCHDGYREGDIRGGISISVPLAPLKADEQYHLFVHVSLMSGIWGLGLVGLVLGGRRLLGQMRQQEQAELELRAAEARHRALLEALPDLFFVLDKEGVYVDYKAPVNAKLFVPPDQFLGRPIVDVLPPDLAEIIMQNLRLALQTGQVQTLQVQLPYPGETMPHHFEARISRIDPDHGLAIVRDVTESVHALNSLQASQASLAKAQQIARLGSWEWNIRTDETHWSDELFRIFGIPPKNSLNLATLLDYVHPDDRAMVSQAVDEAIYGHQPYNFEHRIVRADGVVRIVHEQGEVIYDEATGQPLKMLGTTQDVTEQREAEITRKVLTARLKTLIHNLQSGVLMEDTHRRIVLHNETLNIMLGLPASMSLEGNDCERAAHDIKPLFVDSEQFPRRINEIIKNRQPVIGEELSTVDGRVFERDYVPVYTEGELNGHLWHYRDVTNRVRTREQIKASLQEKEVLLKEIHHRVKNNLQIIASLLYLQANQLDNPAAVAALQESRHRVRSMALIHEQLYQSANLAAIDFHSYLSSLVAFLVQIYRREARIDTLVQAEDIHLKIDAAIPLGLIVNELVSNALKYAFPHQQSSQIHVELVKEDKTTYKLTVRDNGVGFVPELLEPSGRRLSDYSLGMQLVDTLVAQLNGDIVVYNDGGAVVEICFSAVEL